MTALDFDRHLINDIGISRAKARELGKRLDTTIGRLIAPVATSRPGIAQARAVRVEEYRDCLAKKPRAFDVMKDARVARSIYQRDLLRQLLVSCLPLARAITSGASTCFGRLLAALHEARRTQAAVERARYRHLIHDPDTGIGFGVNATARTDNPLRF